MSDSINFISPMPFIDLNSRLNRGSLFDITFLV